MTLEEALKLLAPWGGWSPLLHAATLAMPPHLSDKEMVEACKVVAAARRQS